MTVIHCDLCGCILPQTVAATRVTVSEYRADSCDDCAKRLITFLKKEPYKGVQGK